SPSGQRTAGKLGNEAFHTRDIAGVEHAGLIEGAGALVVGAQRRVEQRVVAGGGAVGAAPGLGPARGQCGILRVPRGLEYDGAENVLVRRAVGVHGIGIAQPRLLVVPGNRILAWRRRRDATVTAPVTVEAA